MSYDRELQTALNAAALASTALLDAYARFEVIPNAPASISTDADRQAQEIILGHIRSVFPNDALCAEETTPTLTQSTNTGSRLWIVDPIDGTRGFARKNGEFSVMVAFLDNNEIVAGVVHEPVLKRLTWAVRGGGCWKRDADGQTLRCHVNPTSELSAATLTQSHTHDPAKPSKRVQLLKPAKLVETYSAGIKLALVARGDADLYLNTYDTVHDWDLAAGDILVTEAGGRVTKLNGDALHYGLPGALQHGGSLASNGRLHEAAIGKMN